MPLNTKEILLVVRARDQATRVITQVGTSFGGLASQMSALQNVSTGLGLEKQALQFGTLGTAIRTTEQDYKAAAAQIGTLTAAQAAGADVDQQAVAQMRLVNAARGEDIVAMKAQMENEAAAIDQQLYNTQVQKQAVAMQQQQAQASLNQSVATLGLGIAFTAAGVAILSFYTGSIKLAEDYETASRKTLTQISGFKTSLKDVEDIGLEVARSIPVPMNQIQAGLFDIFSSIPVANLEDAKTILTEMSKAAVAGATDLQTVARSNFEIINAFGLGVGDLNHVLDVQFKLVQLGIGDYADINTGIGRLAPTARTAGQSIDTLGGTLAFMTRITGDGSQAITAVQRAMESITNPKVQANFEELGINVADALGNFKPFPEIVNELSQKLSNLDPQQRAATIFELFKSTGSGSLNTRKFFMGALDNIGQFNDVMSQVGDNIGAMNNAYSTMADSTQSKSQLLSNRWQAMRIEIGNALLPVVNKLMDAMISLGGWFNNLSESTKKWIIYGGLALGIFLLIVGIVLIVVGVVGILSFALGALGLTLTGVIGVVALVIVGILALAAAGYFIYRNWDTIKERALILWAVIVAVWNAIKEAVVSAATTAWDKLKEFWHWIQDTFSTVWNAVKQSTETAWNAIKEAISTAWHFIVDLFTSGQLGKIWDNILKQGSAIWQELGETFSRVGDYINNVLNHIESAFSAVWGAIAIVVTFTNTVIWNIIVFYNSAILAVITAFWPIIQSIIQLGWDLVVDIFNIAMTIITTIIQTSIAVIVAIWNAFGSTLWNIIKITWTLVTNVVNDAITILSNIIQFFLNIIQGDWGEAWDNIVNILSAAWNIIWSVTQYVWSLIKEFFTNFAPNVLSAIGDLSSTLRQKGWDLLTGLWNGIKAVFADIINWFIGLPGQLIHAVGDLGQALYQKGKDLIQGLINGIKDAAKAIPGVIGDALSAIPGSGIVGGALSHIPGFAQGGIINHPMLAQIGEAGREVVIPLTDKARALALLRQSGLMDMATNEAIASMPRGVAYGSGNQSIVNIYPGAVVINGVNAENIDDKIEKAFEKLIQELQTK